MTAGVPNPAGGGITALKPLGTASFTAPGPATARLPAGTRFVRILARGGGGGGGGYVGGGAFAGKGGGQGAYQRRFIAVAGSTLAFTIGAGGGGGLARAGSDVGTTGADGAPTTIAGLTAAGGKGGTTNYGSDTSPTPGGLGTDGALVPIGYGYYSGKAGGGDQQGIGGDNSSTVPGSAGSLGAGGNGGNNVGQVNGGAGGSGYCYLEFFG